MADLQAICDALIKGDRDTVVDLCRKAMDEAEEEALAEHRRVA